MGVFIFVLILRMNFLKEKSVGFFFFKVFLKFMKISITGTRENALVIMHKNQHINKHVTLPSHEVYAVSL